MSKKHLGVRISDELISAVDNDRQDVSRTRWLERAIEEKLGRTTDMKKLLDSERKKERRLYLTDAEWGRVQWLLANSPWRDKWTCREILDGESELITRPITSDPLEVWIKQNTYWLPDPPKEEE